MYSEETLKIKMENDPKFYALVEHFKRYIESGLTNIVDLQSALNHAINIYALENGLPNRIKPK